MNHAQSAVDNRWNEKNVDNLIIIILLFLIPSFLRFSKLFTAIYTFHSTQISFQENFEFQE